MVTQRYFGSKDNVIGQLVNGLILMMPVEERDVLSCYIVECTMMNDNINQFHSEMNMKQTTVVCLW